MSTLDRWIHWTPTVAIASFWLVVLYAITLYPGGTLFEPDRQGFDWLYNYMCDLFYPYTVKGGHNPSSAVGTGGLVIVIIGIAVFFYQFARYFSEHDLRRRLISICGPLGVGLVLLINTDLHDIIIGVASVISLIALYCMMRDLHESDMRHHLYVGYASLGLVVVNNILFYTYGSGTIKLLPVVEKLSFLFVLGWLVWLSQDIRAMYEERVATDTDDWVFTS